MGVGEVLTAPHSPWQNPFAERLIGSIRRECLNHVLVLGEQHLRRTLARYFAYYHGARTHLSLDKDAPHGRPIEQPELGRVIPIREVGGLHHRYIRRPDAAQPVHHAGDSRVRLLAAHLGPLSFAGGPRGRGPKRLAVPPPTRYRESPGVPCPVAKARAVVNRVG